MTRSWLSSNWLELTISALVAAAEAAMIAPWLRMLAIALGGPDAWSPTPVGLALVGLASFWAAHVLFAGGWDIAAARGISVAIWLGMMIAWYGLVQGAPLTAPFVFIDDLVRTDGRLLGLLLLGGLAWWRGSRLGAEPDPFAPDYARSLVLRGLAVIGAALLLGVFLRPTAAQHLTESAAVALPVLLLTSLSAAAAIQARSARAVISGGDQPSRAGAGWLGGAAGVALVILLIAGLIAGAAGREIWMHALAPIIALLGLVGDLLYYLLMVIAYGTYLLLYPLIWLFRRLAQNDAEQEQQRVETGAQDLDSFMRGAEQTLAPWLITLLQVGLVLVVTAILLWLVLRSLRQRRTAELNVVADEIRESIWSRDLAMEQLRGMLSGLRWQRERPQHEKIDLNAEPADVRDAYRYLLTLAEQQGWERRPNESPDDFAARLRRELPGEDSPLHDLTMRYLAARYGERSTSADVAAARRDWQALRSRFRPRPSTE